MKNLENFIKDIEDLSIDILMDKLLEYNIEVKECEMRLKTVQEGSKEWYDVQKEANTPLKKITAIERELMWRDYEPDDLRFIREFIKKFNKKGS